MIKSISDIINDMPTTNCSSSLYRKQLAKMVIDNNWRISYKPQDDEYMAVRLINKFDDNDMYPIMYPILMSHEVVNQFKRHLREVKYENITHVD